MTILSYVCLAIAILALVVTIVMVITTTITYEKRNQKLMHEKCESCKWYSDEHGGICNGKGIFTSGKYNACGDWRER